MHLRQKRTAPRDDDGHHSATQQLHALTLLRHYSPMKILIQALVLLTLILPAHGHAETYQATAPSNITVQVGPDGLVVHQRSVRYEVFSAIPDDIKVGVPFATRLATITTLSNRDNDDQTDTIEVTVDALSGPVQHRIATFADAGSTGTVASPYFITTQTGCCSPLTRHHVRNIETAKLLFTSTGPGEAGLVALMSVPNHHPTVERWAAFEGLPESASQDRALLGYLRYGDRNGSIDTLALRMNVADQPEEFALDLPDCGALLWVEPGKPPTPGQPTRPPSGTCFAPPGLSYSTALFTLEHKSGTLGGFDLEFSMDGKVYATIPVNNDHLDLAHATLAPGMSLVPAQQTP